MWCVVDGFHAYIGIFYDTHGMKKGLTSYLSGCIYLFLLSRSKCKRRALLIRIGCIDRKNEKQANIFPPTTRPLLDTPVYLHARFDLPVGLSVFSHVCRLDTEPL